MSEPHRIKGNKYLDLPSVIMRAQQVSHHDLRQSVVQAMKKLSPVRAKGENGDITIRFVRDGNKHVANDIVSGNTRFTDIEKLPGLISRARYLKSAPNTKQNQGSSLKKSIKRFLYYEIEHNGRKSYLNVGFVVDKGRSYYCLYAITDYMK